MRALSIIAVMGCGAAAALGQTPSFNFVGFLPNGTGGTYVQGLSADGTIAAGWGFGQGGNSAAFTWTAAGGRNDFGAQANANFSHAFGISADGNVVVGRRSVPGGDKAFRYDTATGTIQNLGTVNGWQYSEAKAASGDGSVVVGTLSNTIGGSGQGFRWTAATGMQAFGQITGNSLDVGAVSRDGTMIVGSRAGATRSDGYVWTEATGIQILTALPGPGGGAFGMNFDGSIIVGASGDNSPAMWRNGQVAGLGLPVGYGSGHADAVSTNGSIAVGLASLGGGVTSGYVWTSVAGPQVLENYLSDHGVLFPAGWQSERATCVSDDGLTIGGWAIDSSLHRQGFVATIPAPAGVFVGVCAGALVRRRRG